MGEPRQVKNNGVLVWQVNKVITEIIFVEHTDGSRTQVKKKIRLRGTAPTKNLARQRLDQKYKEYLVKTGEMPVELLGLAPTAVTTTVGDWLEQWYHRRANSQEVAGSSLNRYRGLLDNHVIPAIGDIPLRLFTLSDVNKLMLETLPAKRKRRKNPVTGVMEETEERLLNNSPMRKVQDILTQSMGMAMDEKKILTNPMTGYKRLAKSGMSQDKKRILAGLTALPHDIVEGLYGKPELGYWVLALMGLRQSERLGVEFSSFSDIYDRETPLELTLNRQLSFDDRAKKFHLKYEMKTDAGERIVIVPERFREALILWLEQRKQWEKKPTWKPTKEFENLIFTTRTGSPVRHQTDSKNFKSLQVRLGRTPDGWGHALRHLVATTLGEQGIHPEVAKNILGHSSTEMTAFYTHFNKSSTAVPLAKVSDVFHGDAVIANEFFEKLAEGEFQKTPEQEEAWLSEYEDNPLYQKYFVEGEGGEEADDVVSDNPDSQFPLTESELYRAVKSGQGRIDSDNGISFHR